MQLDCNRCTGSWRILAGGACCIPYAVGGCVDDLSLFGVLKIFDCLLWRQKLFLNYVYKCYQIFITWQKFVLRIVIDSWRSFLVKYSQSTLNPQLQCHSETLRHSHIIQHFYETFFRVRFLILTDRNTKIKNRYNFFALNFEFFAKTEPGVSRLWFYWVVFFDQFQSVLIFFRNKELHLLIAPIFRTSLIWIFNFCTSIWLY